METIKSGSRRSKTGPNSQKILDALPFQLAIVDRRGVIQRVNAAWTAFALENGGTARIAKGIGIDYLGACRMDRSPSAQSTVQGIESVLAGNVPEYACEYPCHGADQKRWFIMRVSALRGDSRGAAIAHFKITERVLAEKALKRAKRELEKSRECAIRSERQEAEFLAQMSHEIRTPLNGILGMIEMLKDSRLDSAQQEVLRTLDDLADHLLGIVNDVLDLSKSEAGKLKLDALPFDPNAIAEDTHRILSRAAEKKGLAFSWSRPPDFPDCVSGDARRLRQMLLNLAGNAIKFTDKGSVRLTATATPARAGLIKLEFRICDTGPGIDGKNLKQLFRRYKQVDGNPDAKAAGSGLGLVITKNLAEAMDGNVSVKSKLGQGSEFRVSLQVRAIPGGIVSSERDSAKAQAGDSGPAAMDRDWAPGAAAQPDGDRGTVLIADDNDVNRAVLAMILGKLGYAVLAAKDGLEAMERYAGAGTVTAIFLDCQMPRMDGYEVAKEIRSRERAMKSNRVPIVAITADVMEANLKRCRGLGMDELLAKPFRRADVAALLERLSPGREAGRRNSVAAGREAG